MSSQLEIHLARNGELRDVLLDGESRWPTWFKVEWKGNGHVGAKIAGRRLSTRDGDQIRFLLGERLEAGARRGVADEGEQ